MTMKKVHRSKKWETIQQYIAHQVKISKTKTLSFILLTYIIVPTVHIIGF